MVDIKMYTIVDPNDPLSSIKMGFQGSININDVVNAYTAEKLIAEISKQVAERFLAENYNLITAKLDPQAIGNLAIAEAGKQIAEQIRNKSKGIVPKTITINFEENHDNTTESNETPTLDTGGCACRES